VRRRSWRVSLLAALMLFMASLAGIAGQTAAQAQVNTGNIVFASTNFEGGDSQIARYSGGSITNLSSDSYGDQDPSATTATAISSPRLRGHPMARTSLI
jgi:hypothetical protein